MLFPVFAVLKKSAPSVDIGVFFLESYVLISSG